MNVTITRQNRGGFSAKRDDGKMAVSSFDIQKVIDNIKRTGDNPIIDSETRAYLEKYSMPYTI